MRETTVMRALDYVTEACWLLALIAIPLYFDILTVRIFEPDKIVLFRNIVLLMVLAALLRVLLGAPSLLASSKSTASPASVEAAAGEGARLAPKTPPWRVALATRPMLLPIGIFVGVYALATVHSVLPGISFWGSYDRMEGFYTWLNYIAFFLVLSYRLRTWLQIERIVNALIFTSAPIAFYGIMQHLKWDPLPWGADTTVRVASTLGNSIFLGAYLLMCMPFAAYRIWRAAELLRPAPVAAAAAPTGRSPRGRQAAAHRSSAARVDPLSIWLTIAFYGLILFVDFLAMFFSGSKGPYYGLCAAIAVMGAPLTLKFAKPLPFIGAIVLAVAVFGVPVGLNVLNSTTTASAAGTSGASIAADAQHLTDVGGPTSQTRQFIWQGSIPLILHNPLLGYGPETMIYVYAPYYPSGLGHIEHSNAAPDRNHDLWLDFLVFSGILGLLAWFGILGSFGLVVWRIFKRTGSSRVTLLTATILAVVVGDLVEGSVGIPIVSTLMVQWTMFGLVTAVLARPELLGQPVVVPVAFEAADAEPVKARRAAPPPRRGPARPIVVPTSPWGRLTGRQRGGVIGGVVALVVAALFGIGLFGNNLQVVRADVAYKDGQAYDNAANACITQLQRQQPTGQCPYSATPSATQTSNAILGQISTYTGQFLLPQALSSFGTATAYQPNQDMYDLWMGKTYLDKATFDLVANNRADAVTQFSLAEQTLMTARGLNPQNADHPMNLARMYSLWAQSIDPRKWADADKYFGIATNLARHNGRWFDEWGRADLVQSQRPSLTAAAKTGVLHQALTAFTQAADVDDLLGDARAYRGDAQLQLKMYAAAAASYREALRVGGFEPTQPFQPQPGAGVASNIAANLFSALSQAGDYKGMTTPDAYVLGPGLGQAAVTLAYSPTILLLSNGSPYSSTVNSGLVALAAHGYLRPAVADLTAPTQGALLLQPQSPTLQAVIGALYVAKDYKHLVSPVYNGQSLIALAATPAIGLNAPPSPFSATLTTIQATLRQKGYLK